MNAPNGEVSRVGGGLSGSQTSISDSSMWFPPQETHMEPPTPGFTRASRESHWINSFTSVSAFQTAAGGAAISTSWIMERRFAFAVDAVALMVELLLRTISVSCKILGGLIPVSKPGQMAGLAPRGLRTESATR